MRAQEDRPDRAVAGPHRPAGTTAPAGPAAQGPLPSTMAALQRTAGNAAVQRLVEGDGRGLTVDQLRAQLLSRFPGSNPTYRDVRAEHQNATVHPSIDALGEHLGLGATRQPGTTPAAPAAATPSARPPVPPKPRPAPPGPRRTSERSAASAAPAAATTATTPATRPPVPPKRKPAPPGPRQTGERSAAPAPVAAPPAHATAPAAAGDERAEEVAGAAERVEWDDFETNSAEAREQLAQERTTPRAYLRRRAASQLDDKVYAEMAASIKITNKDVLLNQYIAQLYSCLEWTGRAPIAVYTHEAQGKGDLMLGIKTADALRENFPRTEENRNDITVLTAETAFRKQQNVFTESSHPYLVLDGTTPQAPHLTADKAPTHTVVAPQLAATRRFQETVGHWGSNVSSMTEYSKEEPVKGTGTGYTTGLDTKEVGITFDAGLRAYKESQDKEGSEERRRAARLDHLQALKSAELLTALFPQDQEQAVRSFAASASSRLYFAYSNKSAMRFALTVAEVENGRSHDVHVVQSSPNRMPELDDTVKRDLAQLNVARVRLVQLVDGKLSTTADLDIGPTGKTMHWITTDKVPHDDMLTLIKASEPIMMTTGNQSTSEALSAGKTMLYESIGKDQSKAFRSALYSGAGLKPQEIGRLAAISRDYDREGPPPGRPEYQAAAATLEKMQQENTMGAYSDRAWATKDLGRWIGGRHLRDYLMSTELAGGLRSEEAKLRQAPREASTYKDFVQHLLGLPEGGK